LKEIKAIVQPFMLEEVLLPGLDEAVKIRTGERGPGTPRRRQA
jgi:nitrogen regulatory protein PII